LLKLSGVPLQPLRVEALADFGRCVHQCLQSAFDEKASTRWLESGCESAFECIPRGRSLWKRRIPRLGCSPQSDAGGADAAAVAEGASDTLALLEGTLGLTKPTVCSDTARVPRTIEEGKSEWRVGCKCPSDRHRHRLGRWRKGGGGGGRMLSLLCEGGDLLLQMMIHLFDTRVDHPRSTTAACKMCCDIWVYVATLEGVAAVGGRGSLHELREEREVRH
jgi:hypothetical protein